MVVAMSEELICAYCGEPITKNDLWVMIKGKPYHVGCAPKREHRSNRVGIVPEPITYVSQ